MFGSLEDIYHDGARCTIWMTLSHLRNMNWKWKDKYLDKRLGSVEEPQSSMAGPVRPQGHQLL